MKRTNRRRSRTSQSAIRPLSIIFLAVAICAGAYWYQDTQPRDSVQADTKMENLEAPADDGVDAVYTDASQDMHEAVAEWLKAQKTRTTELKTEDRTAPRRATGGTIRWTTRSTLVVPSEEFSKESLDRLLQKSGGKAVLYSTQATTAEGKDVVEYDIAYFDMLDGEQLYLITDKLYVTKPEIHTDLIDNMKNLIMNAPEGSVTTAPEDMQQPAEETKQEPTAPPKTKKPAHVEGRLAIVIDDCGADLRTLEKMNALPFPLTYAVMPDKAYTAESARSGHAAGRKIFVHMPMQPLNTTSSEEVFIGEDMSDSKVTATANELLDQVPYAVGMNNHQGSLATADPRLMKDVMTVLKQRGLAYLDSRTNSASVGEQTAAAMGVATSRNNLFIDNEANVEAIKARLRQGLDIARRNGSAVIIGHCRPRTLEALQEMTDELQDSGIELVFATDLME